MLDMSESAKRKKSIEVGHPDSLAACVQPKPPVDTIQTRSTTPANRFIGSAYQFSCYDQGWLDG